MISTNQYKLLMLGKSSVGKTSLLNRLITNSFSSVEPTLGMSSQYFVVESPEGSVRIIAQDVAGGISENDIHPEYYHKASIICFVVSNDEPTSVEHVRKFYRRISDMNPDCVMVLMQNKCDLEDRLDQAELAALRGEMGVDDQHFFIVSAKSGVNVRTAFENAALFAVQRRRSEAKGDEPSQPVDVSGKTTKSRC